MKRLDVHVGSANRTLEKRPKVFEAINVDMPFRVRNGVVNDLMNVLIRQLVVGTKFVGDNLRAFFDIGAYFGVKVARANTIHHLAANARGLVESFTFQQSE